MEKTVSTVQAPKERRPTTRKTTVGEQHALYMHSIIVYSGLRNEGSPTCENEFCIKFVGSIDRFLCQPVQDKPWMKLDYRG